MERIKDLLNPSNDNLPIHEDKSKGVYVKGLLEVFVGSIDEVFNVMDQGMANRVTASTSMNAESSRSHSIFVLHISQKKDDGSIKTGKLSLVRNRCLIRRSISLDLKRLERQELLVRHWKKRRRLTNLCRPLEW
jgi:hypothetical protein